MQMYQKQFQAVDFEYLISLLQVFIPKCFILIPAVNDVKNANFTLIAIRYVKILI